MSQLYHPVVAVAPVRFQLRTASTFRAPEYKGALFRGGFGHFFREISCSTGAPTCNDCPVSARCPYSLVFETPVLPGSPLLKKYPNAPHPFVMVPPLDPRTSLPPGTGLALDVTLIGRGIEYLPHFIAVLSSLGDSGRYGGKFRIDRVISLADRGRVVYDGATRQIAGTPPALEAEAEPAAIRRLTLDFITPLRMRTGGIYNYQPDFVAVAHALLGRLHLLAAFYGQGEVSRDWMRPLLADADRVSTTTSSFQLYSSDRMSGRQHRRIPMDGVVGRLIAEGDLTRLAPIFRLGQWINVGSSASMGLGRYIATGEA